MIQSGKLKAIGVAGPARLPAAPNIGVSEHPEAIGTRVMNNFRKMGVAGPTPEVPGSGAQGG